MVDGPGARAGRRPRAARRSTGWRRTCRRAWPPANPPAPRSPRWSTRARVTTCRWTSSAPTWTRCGSTAGRVRIGSWEELTDYMNGSAAAVGRIMAPLLGAPQAARELRAPRRGLPAHQLHPRRARGLRARPDLPAAGWTRASIAAGHASERFRELLAAEVQRARGLFREGAPALAAVEPRVRPGMRMARGVYVRVLDRVESLGYDVLGRRAGPAAVAARGGRRSALCGSPCDHARHPARAPSAPRSRTGRPTC